MNNNYKLTIVYAGSKLVLTTTGKTSMYEMKRALAKRFDLQVSTIQFRIGAAQKKFEFSDNVLLCNSGIQSGETITLDVMSSSLRRLNSRNLRAMGVKFDQVPDPNGLVMIRRMMPADNSCLFNSVAYAMERKYKSEAKYLREIVAGYIASEPEKYNELILERPNKDYQRWILDERNWGGAIELEILSRHYSVEICSVDIMTMSVNTFGSDQKFQKRIYVLYDGVHYDAVARNISEDMEESMDTTVFKVSDSYAFDGIMMLAKELNYKAQVSMAEKYEARADSCSKKALGGKSGREYEKKGGHFKYGEISS